MTKLEGMLGTAVRSGSPARRARRSGCRGCASAARALAGRQCRIRTIERRWRMAGGTCAREGTSDTLASCSIDWEPSVSSTACCWRGRARCQATPLHPGMGLRRCRRAGPRRTSRCARPTSRAWPAEGAAPRRSACSGRGGVDRRRTFRRFRGTRRHCGCGERRLRPRFCTGIAASAARRNPELSVDSLAASIGTTV